MVSEKLSALRSSLQNIFNNGVSALGLTLQPVKKHFHKVMPFFGQPFPLGGKHTVLYLGHLEFKFPVGSIFTGVWLAVKNIYVAFIMQPGTILTGKKKCPANTDSTDFI